jgi:hypothetical protein
MRTAKEPTLGDPGLIVSECMRQASVAERLVALPPVQTRERPMRPLLFICPKTNQQAPTGIETDVQSLSASWRSMLTVNCPHCGKAHQISVRETYIDGALDDAVDRLRQAI